MKRAVSIELRAGADEHAEWTHVVRPRACDLPPSVPTVRRGEHALHLERLTAEGGLTGCLACGHPELYTRKDFPRWLGVGIVVGAAALAPFTMYLSLAGAAAADYALYQVSRDVLVCYVCGARHRGFARRPRHPAFDREIDERLRYGPRAVMGRPMREGGTADAPDPQH